MIRRQSCTGALVATLVLAATAVAQEWPEVTVERDVMVTARDGVRLATDVYRPARDGAPARDRLPVLLQRTPYGKHTGRFSEVAAYFARHGYVVAVQDMRGRYASEGEFFKYHRFDAPDGYDTVEWLAAQPWSNGRVGMWGTSYGAHTQADAAKLNPPSLATMVLNQGGMANGWDHAIRRGGAFELGREMTWAWQEIPRESDDPVVKELFASEDVRAWYSALPLREGTSPLAAAPNFEEYFLNELRSSDYGEFWKGIGLNWVEYYEGTADVPMLHIGGWYDIFLRGTIGSYSELRRLKSSPVRLLVGPWTHSGNARTYAGDVDFGAEAAILDFGTDFHLRWFDHFLKGEDTEVASASEVRIFVMGTGDGHRTPEGRLSHGGYWRDADAWPLEEAVATPYYFHADGSLDPSPPADGPASTTYTFDPTHPVPTLGGTVSARLRDGAFDQREREDFPASRPPYLPVRSRSDVLVFQTPPLAEDVTVIGPITLRLHASSTAVDTDFVARLVDVYPPSEDFPTGFDMNVTDGIVRASYRDGRTTRELIEPGVVYELVIEPFETANVFKAGHRIRVDVTSSNFPRWDVNPNTGEPLGRNRRMIEADNTIWHSAERPSHIVLPIVPEGR
jgi:putative CocE/NonD family hydrolase